MWRTASVVVGVSLILATLGIVMLASTSHVHGLQQFDNPNYFVMRQLVALMVALLLSFVCTRIDYRWWHTLAIPLCVISAVLLVLALLPGIGVTVKGSSRWIRLGPINFQPSEFAKLAVIVLMAWYMSWQQRYTREFWRGMMIPLALLGLLAGLIFKAPDFGTTALVVVVAMLIMYAGGTRFSYLLVTASLGLAAFTVAIMQSPLRIRRILAFLNKDEYAQDEAFQLLNAIYAFVVGGPWGVGFGESMQKRFYLPESHTDFIFAIVGEELGLVASLGILLCFGILFFAGIRIAWHAPDAFGRLLAFGITCMITIQAGINIAVVTGVLPTKGLPLPFISYGGSSILMTMVMIGILVNIALQSDDQKE